MKYIFLAVVLGLLSQGLQAQRMVLHGKPLELEVHDAFFTFPDDYQHTKKNYHYVVVSGTKRVCFLQENPAFSTLDMIPVIIDAHDLKLRWFCYRFDERYFEEDF